MDNITMFQYKLTLMLDKDYMIKLEDPVLSNKDTLMLPNHNTLMLLPNHNTLMLSNKDTLMLPNHNNLMLSNKDTLMLSDKKTLMLEDHVSPLITHILVTNNHKLLEEATVKLELLTPTTIHLNNQEKQVKEDQ